MGNVENKLEADENDSNRNIMGASSIMKSRKGELRRLQWKQRKEEKSGRYLGHRTDMIWWLFGFRERKGRV